MLYPFIELLTTVLLSLLYVYVPTHYFFAYFIFFSALIVTIRTDIETMLISRFVTLFLIPFGFLLTIFNLLPINLTESVIGTITGYLFLLIISTLFEKITGKTGIGQGDLDLLAFIGAFTGIAGCWASLTIGSIFGSLFGIIYLFLLNYPRDTKIPFGPFLAFGAISFVLLHDFIFTHFFIL